MTSPVIQSDPSDARNTGGGAISETRPSRPSGVGTTLKDPSRHIAFFSDNRVNESYRNP